MPRLAFLLVALVLLAGCAKSSNPAAESLSPAETFDWCGQPVTFQPPPEGWSREGYGDGGLSGIWCVKKGSVGEAITVADHRLIAERDQRVVLRRLLDDLPRLDAREVPRALSVARWRTDDPISRSEADAAASGNQAIDRALAAHFAHEPENIRWELEDALSVAQHVRVTLPDVIDRVEFRADRRQEPDRYQVTGRGTREVGGEPAISVDYTVRTDHGVRFAREVYVVHDNHLFVARFIGLERNLPLFDRVVASVAFPSKEQVANHGP